MPELPKIKYFGWSNLSLETEHGVLFFDPFFRHYCGAQWYGIEDFAKASVVCVTHGHEEHYLDVSAVAERSGATVVSSAAVCNYLRWRSRIPRQKLIAVGVGETVEVSGFRISTFEWRHRDTNIYKAVMNAIFRGNATQLKWVWSSVTNAPFYAPYVGFHVELPDGTTVMNYNEGFNSKMTDREIQELGWRLKTDVLLGGMQLNFAEDLARGVAALGPEKVLLYPPHDKFHEMMKVDSAPWSAFADAVRGVAPQATVVVAEPGTEIGVSSGTVARTPVTVAVT
ncbi:MAG: MBL fold metallo-hydrolase [Rhodospirillales bacterium]|jgi:hypothetical protein|nr:MBL fold metallo-hydrolase [Rhodospirillales bacterium]